MLIDTYGRVPTDLPVSLTDRCNLRCTYCMPEEGPQWLGRSDLLTDDEIVRLIAIAVTSLGIEEVRFTGGERTARSAGPGRSGGRPGPRGRCRPPSPSYRRPASAPGHRSPAGRVTLADRRSVRFIPARSPRVTVRGAGQRREEEGAMFWSAAQEARMRSRSWVGEPGAAVQTVRCWSGSVLAVSVSQSRTSSPTTGWLRVFVPTVRAATL
ncbi:radical SAM protein [Streptomyces bobili]